MALGSCASLDRRIALVLIALGLLGCIEVEAELSGAHQVPLSAFVASALLTATEPSAAILAAQGGATVVDDKSARLPRPLVASVEDRAAGLDLDHDGLVDDMEGALAEVFRPYVVFDSKESARRAFEPVTIFQVRPIGKRMSTLRVRIKYIFLFERDGGYGENSYCFDSHPGDNDDAFFDVDSGDGGVTWSLTRVHLSFKGREWPRNSSMSVHAYTHPTIHMSSHKHHEYFDTNRNHRDSYYSEWGCNDDVDGRGVAFLVDLSSLQKAPGYRNNIGEPEAHPEGYFVDDLSSLFGPKATIVSMWSVSVLQPGNVWSGDDFYEVGPIREKAMTFPINFAYIWSPAISEETGAAYCRNGSLIAGFACSGRYCDNVSLRCINMGLTPTSMWWTGFFSEEGTNSRICSGGFVTGIDCDGRYCDNVSLECMSFAGTPPKSCAWTSGTLSEEGAGVMNFGGKYLAGVQCNGRYCDNLRFYVCSR
jgi:hypothetical protein